MLLVLSAQLRAGVEKSIRNEDKTRDTWPSCSQLLSLSF